MKQILYQKITKKIFVIKYIFNMESLDRETEIRNKYTQDMKILSFLPLHSNILFHIGHFVAPLPQLFIEQLKEYAVLAREKSMCIVFPYISTTLDDYLKDEKVKDENGVIKLEILKNCLEDIFSALHHLSKSKIVHRDIKENNFLVDEKGKVLMIDFGEAEFYDEEKRESENLW